MEFAPEDIMLPKSYLYWYHDELPHLFNPGRGIFRQVRRVNTWSQAGAGFRLQAVDDAGGPVAIHVDFLSDSIFRLRMSLGAAAPEHSTPLLVGSA